MGDDTLVIYVADHGDYAMDYGLGRKGVGLSDALTRIPMVFAGAGVRSAQLNDVCTSNADIMPTCCEVMGAAIPLGVQGRSLWPLLRGEPFPAEEFRSVYAGVGVGGLYYDEDDAVDFTKPQPISAPSPTAPSAASGGEGEGLLSDTLNKVTQSGNQKMVRLGDWKLIYDAFGYGQLYDLASDPLELRNLYGQPAQATRQAALTDELLRWTIRVEDVLPTGPQNRKYRTKLPGAHNWYAPERRAPAASRFVP